MTLLSPAIAEHVADRGTAPRAWTVEWWLTVTPLRLLTAGDEAVFVFFVLSGLVLNLPVLAARSFDWLSFSAARVWRLSVPTAASIVLSFLLIKLWPREVDDGGSSWLEPPYNPVSAGWPDVVRGMDLLFSDPILNGPTWTLRWELLFSLLLPLAVGIGLLLARIPAWSAVVVLSAVMTGGLLLGLPAMLYLPMFMLGVLLALNLSALTDGVAALAARWPRGTRLGYAVAVVVALAMLSAYFLVRPHIDSSGMIAVAARVTSVLGAALLVALIAAALPNAGWLSRPAAQWLGRISFSLYLVHQPILASVGFALGPERWILAGATGAAASILVAVVFWKLVEGPSHNGAKWFGRKVTQWLGHRTGVDDQDRRPVEAAPRR